MLVGPRSLSHELELGGVVLGDAYATTKGGGSRHCTYFTNAVGFVTTPQQHELDTLLTNRAFVIAER